MLASRLEDIMGKTKLKTVEQDDAPVGHKLVELFWMLGPAYTRWAETHMDQERLTPQRLRLLILLLENGPMKMGSLRNELGVTATNVTALVDALEKDGMVKRRPHPSDRRATMIEITPSAEKELTGNCGPFKERVSKLFSVFSVTEQKELLGFLERIREELIERGILNESDLCSASRKK